MTKEIQQETIRGIALRAKALGGRAMLVGGCVRDALTGCQSADIDCEVYGLAPQALRSLAAEFGEVDESGARYGIFSLRGAGIDLAVPRLERRTGPKHGDFDVRLDPALPFARAAARRDFTVNAIFRDALTGEIVDPFGGREDLKAGVLRCVGDPERRFREDALRILRTLRFAAVLGFAIEPRTAATLHETAPLLTYIAPERILSEMDRALCGGHVLPVLLDYPDVLAVFLPEIAPCVGFDQCNRHHIYDVWGHSAHAAAAIAPEPVLRWTMLLHDVGKPACFTRDEQGVGHFYGHPAVSAELAEGACRRLRMDSRSAERIVTLVRWHDRDIPRTDRAIARAVGKLGEDVFRQLLAVKRADNRAQSPLCRGRAAELDKAGRDVLRKYGYGDYAIHRIGHGQGLGRHEEPYLSYNTEIVLQENMVFTVEPGIYIPGVGGFRHSDTIVVTANGMENVTEFPRTLDEMTFDI